MPVGSTTSYVVAYQAMTGIAVPVSDAAAEVRLGYRWFATGKGKIGSDRFSYGTHNVEAGVLYRF